MYGYEIPRYVREYLAEWRTSDRFLRVRWSLDQPGRFILERKTRYLDFPDIPRGTDRAVQYKDGYRMVTRFDPRDIAHVRDYLKATDIQQHGGAKGVSQRLEALDEDARTRSDRAVRDHFDALSSEAYDRLAWDEGRRVAVPGRVG